MTYYIIYKITNLLNDKIYVGFHKTEDIYDDYMGSGKLIKEAITEFGVQNFKKDIIAIFDNKDDAEALEAEIVNKDFVLRDDTYNLSIGGNVCILYGENNGFYGKHHSDEFKQRIALILSKANKGVPKRPIKFQDKIYTFQDFAQLVNITKNIKNNVIYYCGNPDTEAIFVDSDSQKQAELYFQDRNKRNEEKSLLLAKLASERFTGYQWSEERNLAVSKALTGRKKTEEHVNKVNRNPEKIRKTADKHRGMKRSDEAKRKMSLAKKGKPALNAGKTLIQLKDGSRIYHDKTLQLPDGAFRISKKKAINVETNESKWFYTHEPLPIGWRWKHE